MTTESNQASANDLAAKMDSLFAALSAKIDRLEAKLGTVEAKVDNVAAQVENVEALLEEEDEEMEEEEGDEDDDEDSAIDLDYFVGTHGVQFQPADSNYIDIVSNVERVLHYDGVGVTQSITLTADHITGDVPYVVDQSKLYTEIRNLYLEIAIGKRHVDENGVCTVDLQVGGQMATVFTNFKVDCADHVDDSTTRPTGTLVVNDDTEVSLTDCSLFNLKNMKHYGLFRFVIPNPAAGLSFTFDKLWYKHGLVQELWKHRVRSGPLLFSKGTSFAPKVQPATQ
jgi:hypothetical protein